MKRFLSLLLITMLGAILFAPMAMADPLPYDSFREDYEPIITKQPIAIKARPGKPFTLAVEARLPENTDNITGSYLSYQWMEYSNVKHDESCGMTEMSLDGGMPKTWYFRDFAYDRVIEHSSTRTDEEIYYQVAVFHWFTYNQEQAWVIDKTSDFVKLTFVKPTFIERICSFFHQLYECLSPRIKCFL